MLRGCSYIDDYFIEYITLWQLTHILYKQTAAEYCSSRVLDLSMAKRVRADETKMLKVCFAW